MPNIFRRHLRKLTESDGILTRSDSENKIPNRRGMCYNPLILIS